MVTNRNTNGLKTVNVPRHVQQANEVVSLEALKRAQEQRRAESEQPPTGLEALLLTLAIGGLAMMFFYGATS